jgi:hypothetical protein
VFAFGNSARRPNSKALSLLARRTKSLGRPTVFDANCGDFPEHRSVPGDLDYAAGRQRERKPVPVLMTGPALWSMYVPAIECQALLVARVLVAVPDDTRRGPCSRCLLAFWWSPEGRFALKPLKRFTFIATVVAALAIVGASAALPCGGPITKQNGSTPVFTDFTSICAVAGYANYGNCGGDTTT